MCSLRLNLGLSTFLSLHIFYQSSLTFPVPTLLYAEGSEIFMPALILLYVQIHIYNYYLNIFHLADFLLGQNISRDKIILLPTNLLPLLTSYLLGAIVPPHYRLHLTALIREKPVQKLSVPTFINSTLAILSSIHFRLISCPRHTTGVVNSLPEPIINSHFP